MKRLVSSPALPSLIVFVAIIAAGFVSMGLSWRIAARTLDVADQVPAIISGGVGGLLLVVIGTGLFVAQVGRVSAADERAGYDDVLDHTSEVIQAVRERSSR